MFIMIGKLTGFIDLIYEDYLILDVNGVGYKVLCSAKVLNKIQENKDKISLLIETVVREDSITLFGFIDVSEQECFNLLCKVSGVGNRVAIKIMSVADTNEIFSAIINENKDVFCKASGVGPKVALRIIHELSNNQLIKNTKNINIPTASNDVIVNNNIAKDAVMALEGLGYQKHVIHNIVLKIVNDNPSLTLESVITESLKKINNF